MPTGKKRSLSLDDRSPSSKRVQTRSHQDLLPPTPDDLRSITESTSPSHSSYTEAKGRVPAGPANPGVVRNRDRGVLSRIPSDSDVLDTFTKLRKDGNLSDEEALLKFIATYDVPLSTLSQISAARLPASFSNIKYNEIAAYVWLDPSAGGTDIRPLETFRSRIPKDLFWSICTDVDNAILQYGRMDSHDNEEARSRFIASLFSKIVCLFGSTVVNKPEGLLDSEYTKRGRIEHHFYALNSVSIIFFEVKKVVVVGKGKLDVIAQVLAECAACDYANSKVQHWVPILAILCDGEKFDFLVYDSGSKSVYSSDTVTGLVDRAGRPNLLVLSLKETTEYIFDFFLMGFTNGLRSFGNKSNLAAARSKSKKRASTDKWMDALTKAEHAHLLLRQAAVLAGEEKLGEAEEIAARGIYELMESVSLVPRKTEGRILESCWDGKECVERALKGL
ncbi:hypothetical protein FGG08_003834 [Glutinoglossum americanum]|uniref:Uncharacterized protein n=1 Tax=Glutinoglossum americanum TaxID=1670608 RepID=A0A9P8I8V4_9PEZI|nr:hypothetical protein FGG08_003834 [Glutinoglossum americanum]